MNCANHAETSAVAYCRTCGKPLCANCTRPVKGVIYCEDCLASRVEGVTPPPIAAYTPGVAPSAAYIPPPPPGSGPNPALAGILAGFFPFGVGAVYTGQYAKGLAHLVIFALLVAGAGASGSGSDALNVLCGIGIAFFYVYQIVDAVRTARALQVGQPAPDPFGLGHTFGAGEKLDTRKVPVGAIILILIGVLFLLHTIGLAEFRLERFWPLILMVLGGWLLIRNWGLAGTHYTGCPCTRCRTRRLMGPAILFTVGFLFLLENVDIANFGRTWPVILLVIGGVKLLQSSASDSGHAGPSAGIPGGGAPGGGNVGTVPPTPSSEVDHG